MGLKKIASKEVTTVFPDTSVEEAARLMRDHHVGDVVVVELKGGEKIPVGMLTDRDIVMSTIALGISYDRVLARDIMSPILVKARITDNLYHVINAMKENGIRRIPLVSPRGALEGIVSADDIIPMLVAELADMSKVSSRQRSNEQDRRRKLA